MTHRDFFKAVGFREEDTIVHSTKEADGSNYRPIPRKMKDFIAIFESGKIPAKNHYYSHATHNSNRNDNGTASVKEDNFPELVCLIIDIDYGPHHKDAKWDTLQEARKAAELLPTSTVIIHSGGGLQLVYRFRNRITGHEGKMRYKTLAQVMAAQVHGDACQGIGHVFRVPLTWNYKEGVSPRKSEILEMDDRIDYTLQDLEKWCNDHQFKMPSEGKQKARSIATKKAKKAKSTKQETGADNSVEAFKYIERFLRQFPNVQERRFVANLKTQPFYAHYERFGENTEKQCRIDIRRIRRKLTRDARPQPFVKVKKLKYAGEPNTEAVIQKREAFNQIFDTSGNDRITIALSLMEQLLLEKKQAILNFPCASGKTTAAMILASAYASPENRFWIVTEKIGDIRRIVETLRELGAKALEWHGRPNECPQDRLEFITKKRGYFCRQCKYPCPAFEKYTSKDVWDAPYADILVTTHSHWAAAIAQGKIPSSVKFVIVDESPSMMEYFTLTQEKISVFSKVFDQLRGKFINDIDFIRNSLLSGHCRRIPRLNSMEHSGDIQKYLYKLLGEEVITAEDFEQMQIFLDFFSAEEIYGMLTKDFDDEKMTFIRGTVDLKTSIPHLILDGSALMSDVKWEGFNIYSCPQLKQSYPNTTIEVINGNPSKSFLSRKENFSSLAERVVQAAEPEQNLLLFRNKILDHDPELRENIEELKVLLLEQKVSLIEMNRGEHIGSNKGRLAQVNAVCMSLFNNIAYYVLRTALVYHREIPAEEFWRRRFLVPSMKTSGGFASPEIQQTYCRAIVVDLYQTIMRGCIRNNPAEHYKVICAVSGLDIISVLKEELPGATFHYENEEIVDALLAGEAESKVIELMDGDPRRRYERLGTIRKALGF